ncbi:Chitinase 2 [Basidiobolus ranarum]|uniref:chitinase n=1 Tax=Basidiobolus ranarum TaxID=34480 RepID=A0ABR2W528_9FUNG
MVSSRIAALTAILASLSLTSAFDASCDSNLVAYWGQNAMGILDPTDRAVWEKPLDEYCNDDTLDVINIGFMNVFSGDVGSLPGINLSYHCTGPTFPGTNLLSCPQIGEHIKYCQSKGKKITMSLGGAVGSYGLDNDADSERLAKTVWDLFLGGSSQTRPFGSAVLDGIDLDIEAGISVGYGAFVQKLRSHFDSDKSRKYFTTAAPQCPFPDYFLGNALDQAWFDMVYIQFYNNFCTPTSPGQFNYDVWNHWATTKSHNPDVKLYIGTLGNPKAGSYGYMTPDELKPLIESTRQKYSSFGGVMTWEASTAEASMINGVSFAQSVKNILLDGAKCNGNSTPKPEPKPEPKPTTHKPEPKPTTHKPEPKPTTHKPELKPTTHKPEPKPTTHKPEPKPTTHKPEPKPTTHKTESKPTTHETESKHTTHKTESKPTTHKTESKHTTHKTESKSTTHKSEPKPTTTHKSEPKPTTTHKSEHKPTSTTEYVPNPTHPALGISTCPVQNAPCDTVALACNGHQYGQCVFGKWVLRECDAHNLLTCVQDDALLYCDWAYKYPDHKPCTDDQSTKRKRSIEGPSDHALVDFAAPLYNTDNFKTNVRVRTTSTAFSNHWRVQFDLPRGQSIQNSTRGVFSQKGTKVTIVSVPEKEPKWNMVILINVLGVHNSLSTDMVPLNAKFWDLGEI